MYLSVIYASTTMISFLTVPIMWSDGCGMSYCPDCGPEWATCQYCDAIYCDNGCSYDQLNICEGEGCERRNCNHGDCTDKNERKFACVRACERWGDVWGCDSTYCLDCRLKECKKDWENSCPECNCMCEITSCPSTCSWGWKAAQARTLKTVEEMWGM